MTNMNKSKAVLKRKAAQYLHESEQHSRAGKALLYSCASTGMSRQAFAAAMQLLALENRAVERAEAIAERISGLK